ncbi:MAG: SEC-C metal-binding domain-containing protein [Nitrosopumilaceae archaeon]
MECTSETCKMETHATCPCGSERPYQECCGCEAPDAVDHAMMMWQKAFFDAMHEAQVERLKKRIDTAFGPTMDKVADATVESFGKIWQSMLLQSEGKKELASKLQKIFSETSRR